MDQTVDYIHFLNLCDIPTDIRTFFDVYLKVSVDIFLLLYISLFDMLTIKIYVFSSTYFGTCNVYTMLRCSFKLFV